MKPNKAHHENGQQEPLDPVKNAPTSSVLANIQGSRLRVETEHTDDF